ncbi:MAG: IS21 family transposase [Actinobacteria bacterium]|nr:IS21 family transposase [Actinomycetota bacterium]MCL6094007.1 IS21 family transposase [Actinomycetota bacterium]
MLTKEDYMYIKQQRELGVYMRDIAAERGVSIKTVSRAIKRGSAPTGRRPNAKTSKLDPFKPMIDELLAQNVWNAMVILEVIRERGYTGGETLIRNYIRPKRPLRQSRQTVRFETEPGKQLQNDWGETWSLVAGERTKLHFAVNTLGFSRRFHFWITDKEDAEHTYEGLIRALEHFGGVTVEVLVDNQKSAVLSHDARGRIRYNPAFLDLCGHYGAVPKACRPYRARTKGKDERMVGYIKQNFFQRYRSFASIEEANNLAAAWLAQVADKRRHGTVKEIVSERFDRERPHLAALPAVRFDTSYREMRLVGFDGYIDVAGNRYSVPDDYRAKEVAVRIGLGDSRLRVYSGDELICEHLLKSAAEGWSTVPEHHARLWRETINAQYRDLSVYEAVIEHAAG